MDHLPQHPAILVSTINMLLRDEEYDSLDALCYAFGEEPEHIRQQLLNAGYQFDEQQLQFKLL